MTNGNIKTILTRRSLQWEEFLEKIILEIKETGFEGKLWKPQIERIILRHSKIYEIKEDLVSGFKGVKKLNPKVEEWLKG